MRVLFVRRGQLSTFNVLIERCQLLADVDVQWDRRAGADRRFEQLAIPSDRRRHERRKPLVPDGDLRGYIVVDMPDAPESVVKN
jgi:hypothetical protein